MHHRFFFGAFILLVVLIAVVGTGVTDHIAGARQAPAPAAPPPPVVVAPPQPGFPPQPPVIAPPQPRPFSTPTPPPPPDRAWTVSGFANIDDDPQQAKENAQQNALNKARDSVERFLHEKHPDLHWTSDSDHPELLPEYLKATYLQEIGVIRVDSPQEATALGQKAYEAVAHVDVSDPNLRKMQQKVDEARLKDPKFVEVVQSRHWLVYRILAALAAAFLVVFGYIKLEELTRGYYTTLLRLGAGAVVLLAVLGLFVAL